MGDLSDDTEERTCFVALLRDRSEMPEIEDGRLVGSGEISSALLVLVGVERLIQGDFFNWPPPEFAKCWPVSN